MSEENVEIVRRGLEELQSGVERGEPGAAFDLGIVVDDFEWILAGPFEGQSVWRGREGWVEYARVDRAIRGLVDSGRTLDRCR
jgi:hypothetical protein